jgi:CheY-like chemotaxis protein
MRPTVLIADADELLVAAYRAFFVVEGFQVDWVTNGLDCLNSLRQRSPQALILDAELPWGASSGVLEVMSQDPTIVFVPVVILTARPDALPAPASGHCTPVTLFKPVVPASIALMLRHLLDAEPACVDLEDQKGGEAVAVLGQRELR